MSIGALIAQVAGFAFVYWLGLYMLGRDIRNGRMAFTGTALLLGAVCMVSSILLPFSPDEKLREFMMRLREATLFLPFLFVQGALLLTRARDEGRTDHLFSGWKYVLFPLGILGSLIIGVMGTAGTYRVVYTILLLVIMLGLVFSILAFIRFSAKSEQTFLPKAFLFLLIFPILSGIWCAVLPEAASSSWVLMGNGVVLFLFGVGTTATEIKSQGEAWLPDFFRSLDYSVFYALLFSGLVICTILWGTGLQLAMVVLLLAIIMLTIALQVFIHPLRTLLDNIAFVTFPKLREDSSQIRMVDRVTVLVDESALQEEMDEESLYRYTRRALSHFGDLERLATNPLTNLRLIEQRLQKRGGPIEVIERAVELKAILTESIEQMKPRQGEHFGTSDEWRYYNALYFPYINGIKPYNRRYSDDLLDDTAQEALEWFRTYVPERTFYNWQNAGARLVALRLKEKETA